MTNYGQDIPDPVVPEPRKPPEAPGQCVDGAPASAGGVREVLDVEVFGVADHPFRQRGSQQWLEGAVLVDGDLVPEDEQRGGHEYRDHRSLHPDRRQEQDGMDVLEVDTVHLGAFALVFQRLPGRQQRGVGWRAENMRLVAGVAAMESRPRQECPIHGHFRTVALKPEVRPGTAFDHRFQQEAPGLGTLGGEVGAVEHFVADRRGGRIRKIGCLRQRGAASPCRKLLHSGSVDQDTSTRAGTERGGDGVSKRGL